MHIPQSPTNDLRVLTFREALSSVPEDPGFDTKRWIYLPAFYDEYRYILGTRGEKPLICIGVNPSTAQPGDLDNTLKSVDRIARFNGFDSFIMFNLYPQRATDPNDMDKRFNAFLHEQNMEAFEYILRSAGEKPAVWAAWGAVIEKRPYLYDCALSMYELGRSCGAEWYSCGKRSKAGHPHHPLYLKKDSALDPFDLCAYVEAIRALPQKRNAG